MSYTHTDTPIPRHEDPRRIRQDGGGGCLTPNVQHDIGYASHEVLGKHRVYKAEIGLLAHRALELMFKVLLGRSTSKKWMFSTQNNTHSLSISHDKLQTVDHEITQRLDVLFKDNVMVRGDPHFGHFLNPVEISTTDDFAIVWRTNESAQFPGASDLYGQLVLIDMHSTYRQAYLGDAVQRICSAYLSYIADARPFLAFIETAMMEVVIPRVKHQL